MILHSRASQMSQYMIQQKMQWGYIHGGEHLRIVRMEYKLGRPVIVLSENIPVDAPPPGSMYSLICYMLLTANEETLDIFKAVKEHVPDPPKRFDGDVNSIIAAKLPLRGEKVIEAPEDIQTVCFLTIPYKVTN